MNIDTVESRLTRIGSKLGECHPQSDDQSAILGFTLGSLYALWQAVSLGHIDRTGARFAADYGRELAKVAKELTDDANVSERAWLATFFFNTAVLRLDAVGDRTIGLQKRVERATGNERHGRKSLPPQSKLTPRRLNIFRAVYSAVVGQVLKRPCVVLKRSPRTFASCSPKPANRPLQPTSSKRLASSKL
jgi:hypothetical protein